MTNIRKVVFANDQIYHVFNRGIERRSIFTTKREYQRALEVFKYYRFSDLPYRFSQLLKVPKEKREKILAELNNNEKLVDIIAFCLMPNHFHFVLKQLKEGGIKTFISNFTNSYTKYFNTKHQRQGPLLQGIFKAVIVETDEQLVHLSRYVHLNPVSSFLLPVTEIEKYVWSSLPQYLEKGGQSVCNNNSVLQLFTSSEHYHQFVLDQADYAQQLDIIKHLALE